MPCANLHLRGVFAGRKMNGARAALVGLQRDTRIVHALPAALHAVYPHLSAGKRLRYRISVRIELLNGDGKLRRAKLLMHQIDFRNLA